MAAPDKSRELALVEKVDFQIALAKSDSKLEGLLGKYLAPLLLKLASPHVEVRNQVLKTCEHVNVRVKGAADLKLPVMALLQQFRDIENGLVRHMDLQYIKLGIDRVPLSERLELLPLILKGVADIYQRSAQQSSTLFGLFVRLLPHIRLPPRGSADDTNLRAAYELSNDDAEFLASWLGKLLLYQGPQEHGHAPGLSKSDMEFFTFNEQSFWTVPGKFQGSVNIGEAKLLATKFLVSGAFQESERLIPAIIASADPNSRISDSGQDMLKRAIPATDLEDKALVNRLFVLYTGSPPDVPAARFPLKQRLLGILSKSVEATKHKDAQNVIKDAISPQSYGLEENRLKTEAFAFVIWITRVGGEYMNAEALIEDIKELINSQGWPKPETSGNVQTDKALLDARARAYETIGLLMKSDAKLASSSNTSLHPAQLVQWLFTSLAEDSSGQTVSLSIESAISNAIVALSAKKSNIEEETAIFSVLDDCLRSSAAETDTLQARTVYPALRFANKCFPFANRQARMLNLLALSRTNPRHEVIEEAKNGLDPYLQSMVYHSELSESCGTSASLPDFPRLVKTFFNDKNKLGTGGLSSQACSEGVKLAKNILFHEALQARYKPPVIDQHWSQNIEAASSNDEEAIKAIKSEIFEHYSDRIDEESPLELLMQEALDTLVGPIYTTASAEPLLALLSFSPRQAMSSVIRRANQIQDRIVSNDAFVRGIAAHMYGILRSLGSVTGNEARATREDLDLLIGSFKRSHKGVGAEINRAAGTLLALSHWLARLYFLGDGTVRQGISGDIQWLSTSYMGLLDGKTDKVISEAASAGLVQLALFESPAEFILPILDDENSKALENLKKIALTGNESAVNALGYISLALKKDLEEEPRLQKLIDMAYDLHETRQAEVQFAVGSVFSLLAFGRESKALIGKIDVDGPSLSSQPRQQAAISIIEKVLKACKNTKPSLRQASAIWLLCLVRDGGHTQAVKDNLPACQLAFKALLGDKDSLNQETGSMGLGMVYEQGGKDLKGELIKDLIGTFTETKSSLSGNVSDDTQLFEPGALPTENGQSVTTYKDIINLANEVGDPGLVYRFMSLAANSSIWSSRAAFGRFGLSRVLSDASVDGYLSSNPKLYSSLYRYRFDPNPNVQRAMNDIWTALVKDPTKTVDEHFDHIIQDLLKTVVSKEWRTRQASCAALGDLLQGRQLQKYEKYLNEIWAQTFKVCDDIKGSVRKAAMALARVLTGIVTRTLEAGEASAKTANSMLKEVVPFLLGPSGIEATAKESQAFALLTLLDIIKKGAATVLRPYIPELVGRLLPLLSSLEPEAANYLHLNADKYKITTQDLDDMRTNAVKASPMMEAIERCLDKLDEDSMKALMPSLAEAAKTVIGLPSRVGVARVLISLATRRNFLFKPHVSQFLIILRNKHVTDRNDTVATSAAVACGYLARLAEDKDILKLVEWSQKKYFGEEDERYRVIAGELVHALAKYATDRFASLSSSILPFVYLAKHDTHDAAAQVFKEAWEESVAGNRAVLLHLKEIISLCSEHLDSPRWAIKHASALTVADTIQAAGSDIAEADAKTIWPALEKALAAKTWSGKEKVLESFVVLAKKSNLMSQDAKLAAQMRKIAVREAKRNNEAYKPHALEALSDFIAVAKDTDWFETVPTIVDETIEQLDEASGGDAMDVDSKAGGSSSKVTAQKTRANAVKVLFTSLDPKHREGPGLKDDLEQCLKVAKKALEERDREINETVLESSKQLFERLNSLSAGKDVEAVLIKFVDVVTQFGDAPEQTRLKAVEAAESLAELGVKGIDAKLAQKAGELKTLERNEGIKRKWTALEE